MIDPSGCLPNRYQLSLTPRRTAPTARFGRTSPAVRMNDKLQGPLRLESK
jgi:hypothetical protein